MVEFVGKRPALPVPEIHRKSLVSDRTPRKLPAILTTAAIFATPLYVHYDETIKQVASDITSIRTERIIEATEFAHNDKVGIKPSPELPGVLDLKKYNPETHLWSTYNVIVPNTHANGIETSSELFGTNVDMIQETTPEGDVHFKIVYEKQQGIGLIDGLIAIGNGSHYALEGVIPHDKAEITMKVVQLPDSEPIDAVSLGNYFGSLEKINKVQVLGGETHTAEDYPRPNDGNLKGGDFHRIYVPKSGKIEFSNADADEQQYQEFTEAKEADVETRTVEWRPEFGSHKKAPWFEAVRVTQPLSGEWTFGIEEK